MAGRGLRFSVLALTTGLFLVTADFADNSSTKCQYKWVSGKKQANCSYSGLQGIPNTLDKKTQVFYLTGNDLKEIKENAFRDVGLTDLKNLALSECNLTTVDKNALSDLWILMDLDLSKNKIKTLHAETFKNTPKIMRLLLNDNQIEHLEDGLFDILYFLIALDLSNNMVVQLDVNTFSSTPMIQWLQLNGNKLEHLDKDTLTGMTSIYLHVNLRDNPWRCDCSLQPLVDWLMGRGVTAPPACGGPAPVRGKLWSELGSSDFACE